MAKIDHAKRNKQAKAARISNKKKYGKGKTTSPASYKQKMYMKSLGIDFNNNISRDLASIRIKMKLREKNSKT